MESKYYSIGTFAAMNKVSTRMLRHYDKIGILHATHKLKNGYRCYHDEQIETISQIKRLRACGFLLDEIKQILQNEDPLFLMEEANKKLEQLQKQAISQMTEIQVLQELMQEFGTKQCSFKYGVSLCMRQETSLITSKEMFMLENIEDAIDELFRIIDTKKLDAVGSIVLLHQLDDKNQNLNQVGIPILGSNCDGSYPTLLLPSTPMLSVIHYGNYYTIGHAYSSLLTFAKEYGYSMEDTFMERYFIDCSDGVSPNNYVTEVSVALKNTP